MFGKGDLSLNNSINIPLRGEIWIVDLDPAIGSEMKKTRPVLVMSADAVGRLAIKLVAPITEWKQKFSGNLWHVKIDPDSQNNLGKVSAVDVLQTRGVDNKRFVRLVGKASAQVVEEAVTALAAVVEYQ
ncbi:MAG: type II toxin-antitoxin system PemK/MazF family toxin [Candidatus Omnitrophica bacterium]|nr:type II toxin-antitoxin system PemK/MazF family toxin [Candidatus Omnitrophota bacterium]MBU1127773.1 type II toxin-antitoxin system PemK/MazF family toxin [Candidatus Omnitrophota bacterium]MBU1784610.1 type II toxin-antitoxin system PemK/MazF family toxin [Candidatus Omnitrophota bacterium]MBU1852246.1 type II toxin-antitoxin system PemK/MazF family toxin [Candidatus Omnitrophota bacterium]